MIKAAHMMDGPTLTNESWKMGSQRSKKYEYIWYMELGVNNKFFLGLPRSKQRGVAHWKNNLSRCECGGGSLMFGVGGVSGY